MVLPFPRDGRPVTDEAVTGPLSGRPLLADWSETARIGPAASSFRAYVDAPRLEGLCTLDWGPEAASGVDQAGPPAPTDHRIDGSTA